MNRRRFLRITAASTLLGWIPILPSLAGEKSLVVRIRGSPKGGPPSPPTARRMVERALVVLTGADDPREAWRALFSPDDVVGIKVNCLAGRGISTTPEMVGAVADGLRSIGISEDRIIVWDRNDRDLILAGFRPSDGAEGYRCFGTDRVGFDDRLLEKGSVGSLFSRILTRMCTAVVNMPVLKDHGIAGVSIALKNYFGAIHNPNKYHPSGCNPYVADLNSMDIIRKKERLIVCDCTRVQFHGGPAFDPRWNEFDGSIMVSTDPVALDGVGLEIIEKKREAEGLPPLAEEKRHPRYLETAVRLGIGRIGPDEVEFLEETI